MNLCKKNSECLLDRQRVSEFMIESGSRQAAVRYKDLDEVGRLFQDFLLRQSSTAVTPDYWRRHTGRRDLGDVTPTT